MSQRVLVRAGAHARRHCPLRIPWGGAAPAGLALGGRVLPAQPDGDAIAVIVPFAAASDTLEMSPAPVPAGGGVRVEDRGDRVEVWLDGEELTVYRYADVPARPYFWPLRAPGGVPLTRAWPMAEEVPDETRDHHHHRSLYFAFGAVNGVDNWSEEPGHGRTVHRSVDEAVGGPVFGRLATTADWTDAVGARVLEQKAIVTFWRGSPELRLIDIDLTLTATDGDALFGDTKEGGIVTVRVASAMDVPRGGRIENSFGGVDEAETWGRAAHWCDYSGVVDGRRVGVAVMDHPLSFRYPTYWHVRNYGLMGANPFALGDYTRGQKDGAHLLPRGESLRFVYRLALHAGDAQEAGIREHYLSFVSPPVAEATE
ncbi:MAG: PmoA family protein [Chthonomonadales bacterium]|nr:PmoA family protein [Chthonomonadales bacterium]